MSLDASWWNTWGTLVSCSGELHFESPNSSASNQPIVVALAFTGSFQEGDQVYVIGVGGSGSTSPCSAERIDYLTISDFRPILVTCPCAPSISSRVAYRPTASGSSSWGTLGHRPRRWGTASSAWAGPSCSTSRRG